MSISSVSSFRSLIVRPSAALALAGGLALATSVASAQSFQGLGFLSPNGYASYARGVSDDGLVVVGSAFIPPEGGLDYTKWRAFRWTSAGMVSLDTVGGDFPYSTGRGVSGDSSAAVGWSGSETSADRAILWTSAGMENLGTLPNAWGSWAYDVSDDGSVVVGYSGYNPPSFHRAFRWTSAGGMQNLGALPGNTSSAAYGVSGNGLVVVGKSFHPKQGDRAFRWTSAGGMVSLGTLSKGKFSEAWAANTNGSVVVGVSGSAAGDRAFRWTSAGMKSLGTLPGGATSHAWAVSPDGSVVVGTSGSGSGDHAFLWTGGVMVDLNSYAPAGWTLIEARGISISSTDGSKTIVGNGVNEVGLDEAWVVRLP